jgi:hypothetical protein
MNYVRFKDWKHILWYGLWVREIIFIGLKQFAYTWLRLIYFSLHENETKAAKVHNKIKDKIITNQIIFKQFWILAMQNCQEKKNSWFNWHLIIIIFFGSNHF